jgi:hypothetical protein
MRDDTGPDMPQIDFFDALRQGLLKIASQEPRGGGTDQHSSAGERRTARVRTKPVPEISMTLVEFVAMTEPSKP